MANTETPIMQRIQVAMSRAGARVFRNTVGTFKLAKPECRHCQNDPLRISAGLCVGSPDLVGWYSMKIRPEMVGRRVAVFVGVEVKVPGKAPEPHQKQFLETLKEAGAVAYCATSQEEALDMLEQEVK